MIGSGGVDHALNVAFDDGTSAWFDPSFVAFADGNAGMVAMVGNKRFIRERTGEWVEAPESD